MSKEIIEQVGKHQTDLQDRFEKAEKRITELEQRCTTLSTDHWEALKSNASTGQAISSAVSRVEALERSQRDVREEVRESGRVRERDVERQKEDARSELRAVESKLASNCAAVSKRLEVLLSDITLRWEREMEQKRQLEDEDRCLPLQKHVDVVLCPRILTVGPAESEKIARKKGKRKQG